jgi:hypothetical protein
MTDPMLDFKFSNQKEEYSARSMGWMTVEHNIRHCNLVREKYLVKEHIPYKSTVFLKSCNH